MMTAGPGLLVVLTVPVSAALTGAVRRYALAREVLDIPDGRSSHQHPTPRGGGLAIAISVLGGVLAAAILGWLPLSLAMALGGGGAAIATVGWIDDHADVPRRTRLIVQLAAAVWALLWLGGLPSISLGVTRLPLGGAGWLLGTVGIVWAANLYNFMDGVDGLAAAEAVTVGASAAALLAFRGANDLGLAAALVSAAAAGFLLWNWPPARIFMGDTGSCLLGFLFATLGVATENARALPLIVWAVLLGVFIMDATLTLLRRVVRRERWYVAHRLHAYQRAVQSGLNHRAVTVGVIALNLVLATVAAVATHRPSVLPWCVAAAAAVLLPPYLLIERRRPMRSS